MLSCKTLMICPFLNGDELSRERFTGWPLLKVDWIDGTAIRKRSFDGVEKDSIKKI